MACNTVPSGWAGMGGTADRSLMEAFRYEGGVYADTDEELSRPLRELIPADAAGLVGLCAPCPHDHTAHAHDGDSLAPALPPAHTHNGHGGLDSRACRSLACA